MRAEINFGTRCTSPKVNILPGFTAPPIINILDSRLRGNDGGGTAGIWRRSSHFGFPPTRE
ncbi:MAG: sucrase ferredoxin [Betaproteobacteria bacterium]|nr:sucrase ferredoxin [Betaproteobacteria bacterium]